MKESRFTVSYLLKILILGGTICALGWLIVREQLISRPEKLYVTNAGSVDMCLGCHKEEKLDPAHDAKVIGCASCHLGNALAVTKEKSHEGMVVNPGDLRHVEKTCAVEGCHPTDVHKVKNSLMATNRGILGTMLYYWGEADSQSTDLTVEKLLTTGKNSFTIDYYRKLCATCHLWKQKNDLPGVSKFFNDKGGGCTACHAYLPGQTDENTVLVSKNGQRAKAEDKKIHPLITKKVRSFNCVRCHNRSGRIGISYMGIFESEGYGTPYQDGQLNSNRLPGDRFYQKLAEDVHHAKGMECIDCHTRNEIMGDGTSYAHYEDQLEISCQVCHSGSPGTTRKDNRLTNLDIEDGKAVLVGKVDEKKHPIHAVKKGICDFAPHKRVSCEACHSTWVAQCYGCHVKLDASGSHLDKLSLKKTKGLWEEGRSYIRYERPQLGVWADEVVVVTPGCQDIVTSIDKNGGIDKAFNRFTMAAINPHTTQAKGRDCLDCHASTKTVGLGEGKLVVRDGKLEFAGIDRGDSTSAGVTVPFDAYVNLAGVPLQHSSRADLRPFNQAELQAILRVGLCVRCHNSYDDVIWKKYTGQTVCRRPEISSGGSDDDFPMIKRGAVSE